MNHVGLETKCANEQDLENKNGLENYCSVIASKQRGADATRAVDASTDAAESTNGHRRISAASTVGSTSGEWSSDMCRSPVFHAETTSSSGDTDSMSENGREDELDLHDAVTQWAHSLGAVVIEGEFRETLTELTAKLVELRTMRK